MLTLLLVFAGGFALGLVTAIFIDTSMRLSENEDSAFMVRWVRFRIFVLYLWERKLFYVVLLAVCLLVGLLIGSFTFLPGVEEKASGPVGVLLQSLRRLLR